MAATMTEAATAKTNTVETREYERQMSAVWTKALSRIAQAGYGETVTQAYRTCGPMVAEAVSEEAAADLGRLVSWIAIRSGRRAAARMPHTAARAAQHLKTFPAFSEWCALLERTGRDLPEAVEALLETSDRSLAEIGLSGFRTFVGMGLALRLTNREKARLFLAGEDPEARHFLDRQSSVLRFDDEELRLKTFHAALWGQLPPIVETPATTPEQMRRRAGFGRDGIRLPSGFPGFDRADSLKLYHAALAHVGAHIAFTRQVFERKSLKPLQVAVISLLEDARVERLALQKMPGLRSLWSSFHTIDANSADLATTLMARLSRTLIDPEYSDTNGWVEKGKRLFEEAFAATPNDQTFCRRIGGLLANDLGQMRLQFDARNYVVQPAYRDDNLGIWTFDEEPDLIEMDVAVETEGVRLEQQERDEAERQEPEEDEKREEEAAAAEKLRLRDEDAVTRLISYPEYDHVSRRMRPDWCTVHVTEAPRKAATGLLRSLAQETRIQSSLTSLISGANVNAFQRERRLETGDFLDLDACIDAQASRRNREVPDPRIFGRKSCKGRDLDILLLIDQSHSSGEPAGEGGASVLDLERLSAAIMAGAMETTGDNCALAGFCSDTRETVRYARIKDFGQPVDQGVYERLAGLESAFSTRLGPVMRHGGRELAERTAYRKVLLVVTDGEPSDIDVDDPDYLLEDARFALRELAMASIDVFCFSLGDNRNDYSGRIFGSKNVRKLADLSRLPGALLGLYGELKK